MSELKGCMKCGGEPKLNNVFGSGAYYKCKPCNLPSFQFPIVSTKGAQVIQWNNLNKG